MKKSFMFNGAKVWNSVPKETRGNGSQSLFERKIAAHVKAMLHGAIFLATCNAILLLRDVN